MANAYWNGRFISYGDGDSNFKPLAGALDVAGHEMTHGVVGSSASLEYRGQSGAVNESMADVFGCAMDPDDWTLGEDVTLTSYIPSGALRSLADPHNGGTSLSNSGYQPRTMAELYTGSQDNGGVHINSGIVNWAYYKFATATSRAHGEQVWYRALTTYLNRNSQFIDLRLAVIQAATDLYGATSADVAAARAAFDQVGITGSAPTPTTGNLAVNPGTDYVLSYDTNPAVAGTLYRSSPAGASLLGLSGTNARSKPSINDRGTVAVFVDGQGRIRSLGLSSPYTETIVQNQPIWKSVSISKDGTKLAAVTVQADTSIYLFNLQTQTLARARLYNPTNSAGVTSRGVRYADALEWDYSGEYLIYDALNTIPNAAGSIDYWDIGRLHVWNNAQNTWADGTIEKLVASLPDGISIGNPVLAKVSPKVMALDYFDENGGATPYKTLTVNLDTGDGGVIVDQGYFLGTPSFSKLDDKLLFTARSTAGDTVVAVVGLQANKLQASGAPSVLINEAKWGVWYSQGQRVLLGTGGSAAAPLPGFALYPNPAQDELTVTMAPAPTAAPVTVTLLAPAVGDGVTASPDSAGGVRSTTTGRERRCRRRARVPSSVVVTTRSSTRPAAMARPRPRPT